MHELIYVSIVAIDYGAHSVSFCTIIGGVFGEKSFWSARFQNESDGVVMHGAHCCFLIWNLEAVRIQSGMAYWRGSCAECSFVGADL